MFRWWTWFGGRARPKAPYGLDIFIDAATDPVWLRAALPPVLEAVRDVEWLIAESASPFLEADTEPLFLIAEVR
jgi:hypothetical protein